MASLGLTVIDAANDPKGWQIKHSVDATIGLLTFVPGIGTAVGVGWFVANLVCMAANDGKGISETIQNKLEN